MAKTKDNSQKSHEVFISYSTIDKNWADAACAVLERHRIRCWIAPRDIMPGTEWGASIIAGIESCQVMVLIFSTHANESAQVRREVERAISKGLTVLPFRVEDVRPAGSMEYALSNTHWLDAFTPPVARQMTMLAETVQNLLGKERITPTAAGRKRRQEDENGNSPRRPRRDDADDSDDRPSRGRQNDDECDDRPVLTAKGRSTKAITWLIIGIVGTLGTILIVVLLLQAEQKVREAASREEETKKLEQIREAASRTELMNTRKLVESNNLKKLTLAALNYEDRFMKFPPATGNLSWRVHILPYIEQKDLYQPFNLEQAWDGPRNRQLANTLVKTYVSPEDPPGTTETHYRVFVGPGTLYDPGKQRPMPIATRIQDGTSNTIFAIESPDTVPWPQPKELTYTPNGPLPEVGHRNRDVVLMGMTDGSVRTVNKKRLDPTLFRALITPDGWKTETLPKDW
jgi:hypothetical protein